MQVGTKVIRKSDVRAAINCVGTIIKIGQGSKGEWAKVHWPTRGHYTWDATSALTEATEALVQDVRERRRVKNEEYKRSMRRRTGEQKHDESV